MKNLIVTFAALFLVIGVVSSSHAASFTDSTTFTPSGTDPSEDYVNHGYGDVNKLEGPSDFVRWTHHFEFDPQVHDGLSGDLIIWLQDDRDPWWQPFEFALGWAEDGTRDFGEIDTGPYTYSVTGSSLEDAAFTVTLASLFGDFYVYQSDLTITYTHTPIPSAVWLLGSGLVGLVRFKRKFKK